jgi:hypothetical protein
VWSTKACHGQNDAIPPQSASDDFVLEGVRDQMKLHAAGRRCQTIHCRDHKFLILQFKEFGPHAKQREGDAK